MFCPEVMPVSRIKAIGDALSWLECVVVVNVNVNCFVGKDWTWRDSLTSQQTFVKG